MPTKAEALAELARRGLYTPPAPKLSPQEEKQLGDARAASTNAIEVLDDLTRFQEINSHTPTGGPINNVKNWLASVGGEPNVQQLDEITARIAPAQRVPGSGTTSDMDLRLFLNASPKVNSDRKANDAIVERGRREAILRQQRADFYDEYVSKNGSLNGAEAAFRSMIGLGSERNPYSVDQAGDRSRLPRGAYYYDEDGNRRRNDNGPRGNPIATPGKKTGGQVKRAASAASGPKPGAVEDGYRFKGGDPSDPKAWEKV